MPITSGTHNFGPGESLLTLGAVAAQLQSQTLTGDCEFIQTGNITEIGSPDFDSITMNGFKIVVRSASWFSSPSLGGYKNTFNGTATTVVGISNTPAHSGSYIEFKNLYWELGGSCSFLFSINNLNTDVLVKVHDVLWKGASTSAFPTAWVVTPGNNIQAWNMKIWSFVSGHSFRVFGNASLNKACQFENIVVYTVQAPCFQFSGTTAGAYLRNSIGISVDNNLNQFSGSINEDHNASQDGSATGITGVTTAIFQSVSESNANFLDLVSDAIVGGAGVAAGIAENTQGIRGNARPHNGSYSIGADEIDSVDVFIPTYPAGQLARSAAFADRDRENIFNQTYYQQRRARSMPFFNLVIGFSVLPDSSGRVSHIAVMNRRISLNDFKNIHRRIQAGVKL